MIDDETRAKALELKSAGVPQAEAARRLGLSRTTYRRAIGALDADAPEVTSPSSNGSAPVETAALTAPEPEAVETAGPAGWITRDLDAAAAALAKGEHKTAAAHIDRARGRAAVEGLDIEARIADVLGLGTGGDGDGGSIDASIGQAGKPADPDLMYRVGALFGFLCVVAIGASLAIWWTSRGRASAEAVPEGVEEGAEVAAFEAVVESEVVAALERIGA